MNNDSSFQVYIVHITEVLTPYKYPSINKLFTKKIWTLSIGEQIEEAIKHDRYVVKTATETIGHTTREFSKYSTVALLSGGKLASKVSGKNQDKQQEKSGSSLSIWN